MLDSGILSQVRRKIGQADKLAYLICNPPRFRRQYPMMKKIMWGLRHLIFYVGLIPVTAFFGVLSPILICLPKRFSYWFITRWSYFFVFWACSTLGLRYRVRGKMPPRTHPYVVVSNHQSAWETVFMQTLFPPQCWLLKRELLFIPFFGWGLAALRPIAIRREKGGAYSQLLRKGKERLKEGRWVIVFPEGTRVLPGHYRRFARGGAGLAMESQTPIIPVAHNAGVFWPRGWWVKKPGTIQVAIGPVIHPKPDESVSDLNDRVEAWIRDAMQNMM